MSSFLESLDGFGSTLVNSAGNIFGAVTEKWIASNSPSQAPEKQPDAVVQIPQNGPEQAKLTQATGELGKYMPWVALGLGVVAILAFRSAR